MSSRYLRPQALVGHILVLAAALTCLRLGWWQWHVFEAARGTAQNLGYALLWPVFAGSFIYMWLRFLQLESARDATGAADASALAPDDIADRVDGGAGGVDDAYDAAAGADGSAPVGRSGTATGQRHTRSSSAPARESKTVGMGYVGVDDDDDPELAAYNRALARLAEEDEGRAR